MKRFYIFSALLLSASTLAAHDFEEDGIYYDINSDGMSVTVTKNTSRKYSGDVIIPTTVSHDGQSYIITGISSTAFSGCTQLKSITIPKHISKIGEGAFTGCIALRTVNWNADRCLDFSSAKVAPFYCISGITTFNFGDEVEWIPTYLCYRLSSLSTLTIPSSVVKIGQHAFGGCYGLTSFDVEQGNAKYDSRDNCNAIIETANNTLIAGCKNTIIPNSVTAIASYAFEEITSLTVITIPVSITTIGGSAFIGCTGLRTVNWYSKNCEDFTYHYESPFYGLTGITTFNFGNEVERIPAYLCFGLSGLTAIEIPDSAIIIGQNAFHACTGLTTAVVGNSVTTIGSDAFSNCSNMTSLTLGESVAEILFAAFAECHKLPSLTIPDSTIKIGQYAFANCKSMATVCFGGSLALIDAYAFNGCTAIKEVAIPPSLTETGNKAFAGCFGITSVTWNAKNCKGSSDYFYSPFSGLTDIKTFTFGDAVEKIPAYLCNRLPKLTSIVIPESVRELEHFAFEQCLGLTSITVPKGVKKIGKGVFAKCNGLSTISVNAENPKYDSRNNCNVIVETSTNILIAGCNNSVIPDDIKYIYDYAFSGFENLNSVNVPNGVIAIGSYAFSDCTGLNTIAIPNSVTSFGNYIFSGCYSLDSVTIPGSVSTIGACAFQNCTNLKSLTNLALNPQVINNNVFVNVPVADCKLYVPLESYSKYVMADVWNEFDIETIDGIESVSTDNPAYGQAEYYDLRGVRFPSRPTAAGIYILRHSDGSSRKVIIK